MKKKGVVYRKMFFSFMGMLVIPLVITIFFYLYTYRTIENQAEISNNNLLETIQNTCDSEIQYYQDVLLQLSNIDRLKRLETEDQMLTAEGQHQVYLLLQDLADYSAVVNRKDNHYKEFFVCLEEQELIFTVAGSKTLTEYVRSLTTGEKEDMLAVREYITNDSFQNEFVITQYANGNPEFLLLTNSVSDMLLRYEGITVGLWVSMDVFHDKINSVSWESGFDWAILDKDNTFVRVPKVFSESNGDIVSVEDGEAMIGGKPYVMYQVPSEIMDWQYVLLMPESITNSTVINIRNVFILSLLFCVILGYSVAGKVLKINYAPINELMNIFQNKNESPDEFGYNEHLYLKEKTKKLLEKHQIMSRQYERNVNVLKEYYLEDIITGGLESADISDSGWESLEKRFQDHFNLVILLKWEKIAAENLSDKEYQKERSLRYFVTENIFSEGIGNYFCTESVELYGDVCAMIISIEETQIDYCNKLRKIIEELQKLIRENFQFSIRVAVGTAHRGRDGIHQSYLESCEAERFLSLLDQEYVCFDEVKDRTNKKYGYSFEKEERIVEAIRSNNIKMANSLIGNVLETSFNGKNATPELLDCLLYDIFGTILKAGEENNSAGVEKLKFKGISVQCSLQEIKDRFSEMVKLVCEKDVQETDTDSNIIRCRKILNYIEENYYDPNLNVSQIGEYFQMTPSYLSSLYRKKMGSSLVTVINETRVRHAVEFLREDMSVYEIAEKCGFTDSSTFIKVFKKCTGVTPGEFKKMM